jgi:hypothetical protein
MQLRIVSSTPRKFCHSVANDFSFSQIAEEPNPHLLKYSLTPRAAAGVLKRAEKYGYRLSAALLEALLSCIRRG